MKGHEKVIVRASENRMLNLIYDYDEIPWLHVRLLVSFAVEWNSMPVLDALLDVDLDRLVNFDLNSYIDDTLLHIDVLTPHLLGSLAALAHVFDDLTLSLTALTRSWTLEHVEPKAIRHKFNSLSMALVAGRNVRPSCPITLLANDVARNLDGLLGACVDHVHRYAHLTHSAANFVAHRMSVGETLIVHNNRPKKRVASVKRLPMPPPPPKNIEKMSLGSIPGPLPPPSLMPSSPRWS